MRSHVRERNGALGDALIDLYVDWREECAAVQDAYERWSNAARDETAAAYAAYRATLDREERAGNIYADLVRRVRPPTRLPG
jgi:hypothetical protein